MTMSTLLTTQATATPPRRTAEYHPSVWGDSFITHVTDAKLVSDWTEQAKVLKEEVRKKLKAATSNSSQQLKLIDVIQRLGIGHHYQEEIGEALRQVYSSNQDVNHEDEDLLMVALRFRLLRQQGYNCSSGIFNKFKDGTGKFKENLVSDVEGMLSLYEASFLSIPGEDILDEVLEFTSHHLKSMATQLGSPLADQVSSALKWPLHFDIERKVAWDYISYYQQQKEHDEVLLKLAKLDYNIVQVVFQNDLRMVSKWWIDNEFVKKLPYVRDRIVECFFWAIGTYPSTKDARARRQMGKLLALITIIDDTYDAYGLIDELELFAEAIERWDIGEMDRLPDYMKVVYQATLDIYDELEAELAKEGRSFCVPFAIETAKHLVRAYLTEMRWFNRNYVPTMEEYKKNGLFSTGYLMLHAGSQCGLGDIASKEVIDWMSSYPMLLNISSVHGRIINDIKSHEFEQERGHAATVVECYMKEHGVSTEEAHTALWKVVSNMWKEINEELLKASDVPLAIRNYLLGFARATDALYKDVDSYTHSNTIMKNFIAKFAVNPFEL